MSEKNEVLNEDWQKITDANKLICTTKIKDKEYATVNERVKAFRYIYPRGTIKTTREYLTGETGKRIVCYRCEVYDDRGVLLSDGEAEECESSSYINKTSFIENCQTSAVGRALGFAGLGIDVSIASKEEVENAIENQKAEKKATYKQLEDLKLGYPPAAIETICNKAGVLKAEDLPQEVVKKFLEDRKDIIAEKKKDLQKNALDVHSEPLPFY